jgi:riboflavin kinase/FMN adenylyltransferase
VIEEHFAPRGMVEGPDFHFGRGRGGSVDTLRRRGFEVRVVDSVAVDLPDGRQIVSSTLIRRLLLAGRIEDAARCLDRLYVLQGRVIGGRRVGRVLEFPTANLDPLEQVVPADGVYAGWAAVGTELYAAAISIGDKPTFNGEGGRAVEAFLIGASGDYYGCEMTLSFARRLRDQERFPGVDALKAQIARDVENVRAITRQ